MFLGHFAAGLVASRAEPRLPLGTAFVAAQLPDAIWPYLLLAGVEKVTIAPGDTVVTPLRFDHYPWSHSLVMVLLWGALFSIAYRLRGRPLGAAVLLLPLVFSHWVLDVVSHRPDVPLVPAGGPLLGLGLWNSRIWTLLVEGVSFGGSVWFFSRGRRLGWGFWALVILLGGFYLANVFGPPPPSTVAIAIPGIAIVPILWWWANRSAPCAPAAEL